MGSAVRSITRIVTRPLQSLGILPKAPKMPAPPAAPKAPTTVNAAPDIESAQMDVKKQYAAKKGRKSTIMTGAAGLQSEEEITRKKLLGTES